MKTQVGIIGAGPAGLFLSHLLKQQGIESVILEARSRAYAEGRVRAGVLEASTIKTMERLGLGERMHREGLDDTGLDMRFRGQNIHLDLPGLTGMTVKIYGQQEVVKDLMNARIAAGDQLHFEAEVTELIGLDSESPKIRYVMDGEERILDCDFVAGCDGYHGISRASLPEGAQTLYHQAYDFAWLGVLARARPIDDMTYTNHDRGFALCSRRSMEISRLYLQVPSDTNIEDWSDDRFWDELHTRMFDADRSEIMEGEIFQRDMAQLRAFVAMPMQYGRLYMAGDAVHIVPPAGAKGLNMAVADARVLARAFTEFYRDNNRAGLDGYTDRCSGRVWKTIRYSAALTGLLHRFHEQTPMQRELQLAEMEYIAGSKAAQTMIAEQYANLSDVED